MMTEVYSAGFPHSEISGSKVARHLPEAYRSRATPFIATSSQGIHRMPLGLLSGNLTTATCRIMLRTMLATIYGTRIWGSGIASSRAACSVYGIRIRTLSIMSTMMRQALLSDALNANAIGQVCASPPASRSHATRTTLLAHRHHAREHFPLIRLSTSSSDNRSTLASLSHHSLKAV